MDPGSPNSGPISLIIKAIAGARQSLNRGFYISQVVVVNRQYQAEVTAGFLKQSEAAEVVSNKLHRGNKRYAKAIWVKPTFRIRQRMQISRARRDFPSYFHLGW
jgi:hypothetical protein